MFPAAQRRSQGSNRAPGCPRHKEYFLPALPSRPRSGPQVQAQKRQDIGEPGQRRARMMAAFFRSNRRQGISFQVFFFLKKLIQSISGAGKNTPEVSVRGPFAPPSACLRDPSGILGWFQVAQPEATSAVIRTAGQARHVVPPGTLSGPILTGKGWRAIVTGSLWTLAKGSAGCRHPPPRSPAASWPELKRQAGRRAGRCQLGWYFLELLSDDN